MRLSAAAALALFLLPAPLRAQDPPAAVPQIPPTTAASYIGKPIVSVRIETEGRATDEPALTDLVQTRAGEPLSMSDVRESITHLFSLGRFQDVQVDATDVAGGVQILYNLIPLHSVHAVEYTGTLGLSKSLIERTVSSRFGARPPVGRAPEVARVLQQQLFPDHGYLRASVRAVAVEEHDPDRTILTFQIDSGPRARIGEVIVDGLTLETREEFLRKVGAVSGTPYEPLKLGAALDQYAADLREKGRYEAAASFRASPSENGATVTVTIDVQPGPIVTLRFEGDPLPADRVEALVPVQSEASAHADLIEDSEVRIGDFLAQQGYWKASATSRTEQGNGRLTIVFTVRKGLQYRIAGGAEVRGNESISPLELAPVLARLQADQVFNASNMDAAVATIDAMYRQRGFAQVKVTSQASELNPLGGVGQVKPIITIVEGPLTLVGQISFDGEANITEERLRGLVQSVPGAPYYVPRLAADREAVLLAYLNEGFASANVQAVPTLLENGTRVHVAFQIEEGPQTLVDHILIVGNNRTDDEIIRRELLFRQGEPLGLADLVESRRRISALGLFRRVAITDLSHGGSAAHDVLVTVEEAPATTVSYGGGLEASRRLRAIGPDGEARERLEFAPRGFFDIGRRNVGGKNRSINLFTRVSLRPRDATDETDGDGFGFSEYRIVGTYREPRPYGLNGDLTLTGALEQGIRSTFNFVRKGVTADLQRRLTAGVRAGARYSFSTTRTYDERLTDEEQALIDRRFPRVRLSTFAGAVSRDTRDDLLDPSRGMLLGAELSVATRALGGQVGFLKSYGQALWFQRVPSTTRVVFAARAALGLAGGFPRDVAGTDEAGNPTTIVVDDLPASERFFAGGDTSIRGFALDTVGTPETISPKGFPRGGNAVLVLNGELRFPVWKAVGAAVFVDGGNVFGRTEDFDLGNLRGSAGFGVRYRSPIGPVRLDFGFKMDRRFVGDTLEGRRAIHFSIGQAF